MLIEVLRKLNLSDLVIPDEFHAFAAEALQQTTWYAVELSKLQASIPLLELSGSKRADLAYKSLLLTFDLAGRLSARNTFHSNDADTILFYAMKALTTSLLKSKMPFTEQQICGMLDSFSTSPTNWAGVPMGGIISAAEKHVAANGLTPAVQGSLERYSKSEWMTTTTAEGRRFLSRLNAMLQEGGKDDCVLRVQDILPNKEPWTDAVNLTLNSLSDEQKSRWMNLLVLAKTATGSKPSGAWMKRAEAILRDHAPSDMESILCQWFHAAHKSAVGDVGYPEPKHLEVGLDLDNAEVLRGLVWLCAATQSKSLAVAIGELAEHSYKKLPWVGARSPKVANACCISLALMTGDEPLMQLARLASRVKQPTGRKVIEKTLNGVAQKRGLSLDELRERLIPTFGLVDGQYARAVGDYGVTLTVDSQCITQAWKDADGKSRKATPAQLKVDHKQELNELKQLTKELEKTCTAERIRMERLFLRTSAWQYQDWKNYYQDHPLVSQLARRLIWEFELDDGKHSAAIHNGELVSQDDRILNVSKCKSVRLWHPATATPAEVLQWRSWLDRHQIVQPFKQAHREVYLLTDAERTTDLYSNRFAAHVLRQHQFQALCDQRGWTYRLMGAFDSHNTPSITLPQWNTHVEFWVDSVDEDAAGTGIYLHITTDQVRFVDLATGAQQQLAEVPALLFSELMRDVDLFVGVSSVGNDPTWQDGGPQGRYQDYWQSYSFGDLGETAKTRRAVLETLLPRMTKIKGKWTLSDKFLIITGALRTYKIHLGSGNILMEPNDQYLCIVPGRSDDSVGEKILLPFEGDRTLSIILSKALLLAEDTNIKDSTITRQINLR